MIDERQQELASLHALGLLEGDELAQFEAALARDPELQTLVRELRESSAALAHTARVEPPPETVRSRVLASIEHRAAPAHQGGPESETDHVVRPAIFSGWNLIPWAAAACFALAAGWIGLRYVGARSESGAERVARELAEVKAKSTQQLLEATEILNKRRIQDTEQQLAAANTQLGEIRSQVTDRERLLAEARTQLADRDRQLADSRTLLGDRDRQVATLSQRVESLAAEMKSQGDLANLKIAALSSLLKDSPEARAIAVWDPRKQEGVFAFDKLPPVGPNQKLELWVIEAKPDAAPISAGVMEVAADGTARLRFKPSTPVAALAAFAVSREKNDGARSHVKPDEVIMLGHSL